MKINILEERFKEVPNISAVKTYIKRFDKYDTKKDCLTGTISVDLSYYDDSMTENFQTISLEFDVTLKDDLIVNNVTLLDLDLWVVDKKGVSIKYNIEIDYEEKFKEEILDASIVEEKNEIVDENIVEEKNEIVEEMNINEITDKNYVTEKTQEELVVEQMSEEINKEYDQMLGESLKSRNENVMITSVVDNNERTFLDLFNMFEAHHLKITKIYVNNKENIRAEYNMSEEEFDSYYDKENNILTIKSYD